MSAEPQVELEKDWQPRILAFVCRWCTYAGADLAGTSRLKYPPQIRIVKLPCSGRIDPLFLLRGFEMGADGILVSGCHPGDCHYISGNYYARRRWVLFTELLNLIGLDPGRQHFSWVSAAEGAKFVDVVKKVTDSVLELGPFPGFAPRRPELAMAPLSSRRDPVPITSLPDGGPVREDLRDGKVRAVLGYRKGRRTGTLSPTWMTEAESVDDLLFATSRQPALITHLVRRLREDPEGVYGIVAGPKEAEAIALLLAESQIPQDRVRVYHQEAALPAEAADPLAACGAPGLDRPASERWDYWTAQFARCLRCNACRESCSLCSCVRCVQEKTRPRWIDSSATPAGNWIWNVTRAFHLSGRCVGCGACEEACPVGIPLLALNRSMIAAAEKHFGPRGKEGDAIRSPLIRYETADEAPFIL